MKKKLLVLGESYMNLQMQTNPPKKDEEVTYGSSYSFHPYGDGAATAISAAKLGGECVFCTKLGDDTYGERLKAYYKSCGLHLSSKEFVKDSQTGMSVTVYNDVTSGHTYITKGANLHFTKQDVEDAFSYSPDMFVFPQEDILSQQKEDNVQRPFKVLHQVALGSDDTLKTVLRFRHTDFSKIILHIFWVL